MTIAANTILLPIEREAIRLLVAGDGPVAQLLQRQLAHTAVVRRQVSAAGSFTYLFQHVLSPEKVHPPDLVLSSLNASYTQCPNGGIGFVVYCHGGFLNVLEAFTYEDIMPSLQAIAVDDCVFSYVGERVRDLQRLASASIG